MNESGDTAVKLTDYPKRITGCSFVVPARNEELHLDACLKSLKAQSHNSDDLLDYQLIVVDNASTDQTVRIASRHDAMIVSVPPGNPGRARNAGVKHAIHEYIAFIDADCVLPKNWFLNTRNTLNEPEVVAVGCPQARAPRDASWVERVWVNTIIPTEPTNTKPVTWLPSFNLLMKRANFLAIGGFDESLETCEDSDLSYRLGHTGKLICNSETPVRHLGESRTLPEFFQREMWRSRGNLSSARKRGTMHKEFLSLFAPLCYAFTVSILFLSSLLAVTTPILSAEAVIPALLCVFFIPVGIAFIKGGANDCLLRSALIVTYLFARAFGLIISGRRVERKKLAPEQHNSRQLLEDSSTIDQYSRINENQR